MKTEMERSRTKLEPYAEKHTRQARTAFPNGTDPEPDRRIVQNRNLRAHLPARLPKEPSLGIALPGHREPYNMPATPPPVAAVVTRAVETDCLAHDARNWLTALRIYCDLLGTSDAVAGGEAKKWMEELSNAVARGHQLVNSLLDSIERTSNSIESTSNSIESTSNSIESTSNSIDRPSDSMAATRIQPDPASFRSFSPPAALRFRATDFVAAIPPPASTRRTSPDSLNPSLHPSLDSLNPGAAIARRLPLFQRLAGSAIQVEMNIPANAGDISLPETSFERILQNLVGNAIEAMPQGGRLRIALRPASRTGDELVHGARGASKNSTGRECDAARTLLLRVSDTGHGIPPERLRSIFEAGVSGKPEVPNRRPRHGFGLAIVRTLTERAGGTVRVRSHVGWGSCFEVELPMA